MTPRASPWKGFVDEYLRGQQQERREEDDDALNRLREILKQMPAESPAGIPRTAGRTAPVNVDDYMRKNRSFESGGDKYAVNQASGATGLYQFLPSTWTSIMKEAPDLGLTVNGMHDEVQQNAAMKFYTDKSRNLLKPLLGRDPTGGELYALHLLGHTGGSHLIGNLARPLTEIVDKRAMDANPWLYQYRTGEDLINALNRKFG